MNTLAACAASAWYLTLMGHRAGMVGIFNIETELTRLAYCHLLVTCDSPYLPRGPGEGML